MKICRKFAHYDGGKMVIGWKVIGEIADKTIRIFDREITTTDLTENGVLVFSENEYEQMKKEIE